MQISKNTIYISVSLFLAIVLAYLAYRFLLKANAPDQKQKEKYFALLDEHLKDMSNYIKSEDQKWRVKIKEFACLSGVTFDQALARDLAYTIEQYNSRKITIKGVTYEIPLDVLIQWRDQRDGRSPYYGTGQSSPDCTNEKIKQIYREEGIPLSNKQEKF